jgi:hypothetical protein
MTPQQETATAFHYFNRFTDGELAELLSVGGIVPCKDRTLLLQQTLVRWFVGGIPSLNTFIGIINNEITLDNEGRIV